MSDYQLLEELLAKINIKAEEVKENVMALISALNEIKELTDIRLDPMHNSLDKYKGFELAMQLVKKAADKAHLTESLPE